MFAAREPGDELAGLPELVVEGLQDADARRLLKAVIPGRLDERVADQLLAETGGTRWRCWSCRGVSRRHSWLGDLVAGRAVAVWSDRGELPQAARGPARGHSAACVGGGGGADRRSGPLVACGRATRDRRPGARDGGIGWADRGRRQGSVSPSAGALRGLPGGHAAARRRVHRALAEATDPRSIRTDAPGIWLRRRPALTRMLPPSSSGRPAGPRRAAGLAAAAAFLERAAALTAEPQRRGERALAAAQTKYEAGALDDALALLRRREAAAPILPRGRAASAACSDRVRLPAWQRRTSASAEGCARARISRREARARDLPGGLLRGVVRGQAGPWRRGRRGRRGGAGAGSPSPERARPSDLLLHGLAIRFTEGYSAGAPILKEALSAFRRDAVLPPEDARWLWFACWAAADLWDDETWDLLSGATARSREGRWSTHRHPLCPHGSQRCTPRLRGRVRRRLAG